MRTVYNTGKVKIGLTYEPPKDFYMTLDECRLQEALLSEKKFDVWTVVYYVCYVLLLLGLLLGAMAFK
jgi:hypothetical protein